MASIATWCGATGKATTDNSRSSAIGSPAAAICISATGGIPTASVNFITAHDGFTLEDLVSYNDKHNEANGEEESRWNERQPLLEHRRQRDRPMMRRLSRRARRQKRNLLATLLLSQGVPMICGGDEIGRTQRGNNNAYCQDNEISWYDWKLDDRRLKFLDFTRKLIALRRSHPNLRRRKFYQDPRGVPLIAERYCLVQAGR